MGVTIKAGQAYVTATPSSQNSQVLRVRAAADYTTYTINANSSGSTKYDWVYLSISATNSNDPSADGSNVASFVTSRSSSNSTDDGSPPTYGIVLAVITVANGASSITNSNIVDKRVQASVSTAGTPSTTGWNNLGYTPSSITANGNRSYSLVFSSVDLTGTVSNGMRLKLNRTSPAPTQCTSLNGTTQFYSNTSPAGMTFTDDFVVSAWVKMTQYGAISVISSRYNGTSGWAFYAEATGQITLVGFNASSTNFSAITSYQSIHINQWVHVSAQLDMSTFTATSTTSYVMIDGVNVPASVSRGGTNPTALVQAGNLEIGSRNGGLQPFPGKIAQVAIYSAKVTQANMRVTVSQGLAGTETSLISAYSFNNSINDLNANANNLTANGSAVATNADSPFAQGATAGSLEYGIITGGSFSTNTTLTVQVPEGSAIPTSGGVSAVSYSSQKIPYGFPGQKGKWAIAYIKLNDNTVTSNATFGSYASGGVAITVPIGSWKIGYILDGAYNITTTIVVINLSPVSLTGLTSAQGLLASPLQSRMKSSAAAEIDFSLSASYDYDLTTATTFTMYTLGSTSSAGIDGGNGLFLIYAECAHL